MTITSKEIYLTEIDPLTKNAPLPSMTPYKNVPLAKIDLLSLVRLSLQIEPPARKSLRGPSRGPPYPSSTLRSYKSSEDLLTPPLEPEYTGPDIATPPRRTLTNRFSESDIRPRDKRSTPVVATGTPGIPLATRLQAKGVTLPPHLDVSGRDWKVEAKKVLKESASSEGQDNRKVKSSSPSLQPKKKGHAKTQSLGNK